jgi:hypothetical protein
VVVNEEPRLRIVLATDGDGTTSGLTIYMNSSGQLALLRALATLGPSNRHTHLEALLTPSGEADVTWADVVFTEGRGDVAHAPPS